MLAYEEETAPISLRIINHTDFGLIIKSIGLKQKVVYTVIDRSRGPRTEKIHCLNYSEYIPPSITEINRVINMKIPPTSIMEPDIDTLILKVKHFIDIKVQSVAKFSKVVKVQVPLVITGFPFLLFEPFEETTPLPRYE